MDSVENVARLSAEQEFPILWHGFADYMRDYEILVAEYRGIERADNRLYQFVGCVDVRITTNIDAITYVSSLISPLDESEASFDWNVRFSTSDFGIELIDDDELKGWRDRLGVRMYKAVIVTDAFVISLFFHDLVTRRVPKNALSRFSEPILPL